MRMSLFVMLLLVVLYSSQSPTVLDTPPVAVSSFSWTKSRQEAPVVELKAPAPPVTQNPSLEQQRKGETPAGQRQPSLDTTVEMRSTDLDRIVQKSRQSKSVDGFEYKVKMRNASNKTINAVIWEYQFKESQSPTNVARRQFLCRVDVKPENGIEFRLFTTLGPSNVISVESLTKNSRNLFEETVLINYVKCSDGSIWQRKDWDSAEAQRAYDTRTTRVSAQCVGL